MRYALTRIQIAPDKTTKLLEQYQNMPVTVATRKLFFLRMQENNGRCMSKLDTPTGSEYTFWREYRDGTIVQTVVDLIA